MSDSAYRSFDAQGKQYFRRPHTAVPSQPIDSPAAWHGEAMRDQPGTWRYDLTDADVREIQAAVASVREHDLALESVTRDDFPLPALGARIAGWRDDIMQGIGFRVITGLPVATMDRTDIEIAFWGIGHHLGMPGAQNPDNELLGHVRDYQEAADDPFVRLYRTTANIRYHCDGADMVGLLCLHPAKSGGQSRIVSTVALFNELLAERPDLAPRIFEPFRLDRRGEMEPGQRPYSLLPPARYADGQLRTFYHSDYFRSVARHPGVDLSLEEREILDFYDRVGMDPAFYLDMWLQQGDMQFVSNHTIAHARTEYEDFPEPERKRHLLRLWLSDDRDPAGPRSDT